MSKKKALRIFSVPNNCTFESCSKCKGSISINRSTPEIHPSPQRCLTRMFTGILIFKELTARRLYKSFRFKELTKYQPVHEARHIRLPRNFKIYAKYV
jgi:hypothetical protein